MLSPKVNVVGVIYQNSFGERYYSKYFTKHCPSVLREPFNLETFEGQRRFEKALLDKVARMNVVSKLKPEQVQIFSLGETTVLLKVINELQIYLLCEEEENYFVMEAVIDCIGRVLAMVEKQQLVGKVIYDHLDSIVAITDQLIDEGIVVHLDPSLVFDRVKMREPGEGGKKIEGKPAQPAAGGSAFSNFFGFAKSSLQKTLNLG